MSQDSERLIAEARALAARGHDEKARESLLMPGFIAAESPAIQAAYIATFLLPTELKKNLPQVKGLLNEDAKVRAKAAAWLCKETRGDYSLNRKAWLRDPRLSEILIAAFARETESKIRRDLALSLSALIVRYFPDRRAFPALVNHKGDKEKVTRRCIADGIGHLRHPKRYEILVPMLADRASEVRQVICRTVCDNKRAGTLLEREQSLLREVLPGLLADSDMGVRQNCVSALRDCGDKSTIPLLESALQGEKVANAKDGLQTAIAVLKGEIQWK